MHSATEEITEEDTKGGRHGCLAAMANHFQHNLTGIGVYLRCVCHHGLIAPVAQFAFAVPGSHFGAGIVTI
jgi:hypothetical protein